MVNLYEILGVQQNATNNEIKKAFRILAKKYHPDVSKEQNAQAKFNEVYSAYEILCDASKRKYYDNIYVEEEAYEYEPKSKNRARTRNDEYVNEWRRKAYETANGFGRMTFKDFRDHKILVHQWSSNQTIETLLNIAVLLLLIFGIGVAASAFPFIGTDAELVMKERQIGFGFLIGFVCIFLTINTIRIQLNNMFVRRSLD